jgi:hypothetical protein
LDAGTERLDHLKIACLNNQCDRILKDAFQAVVESFIALLLFLLVPMG